MRTKRAVPGRPRLAATAVILLLSAGAAAACSGSASSSSAGNRSAAVSSGTAMAPAASGFSAAAGSAAEGAPGGSSGGSGSGSSASAGSAAKLVPSGQQLIYTAQLTVRAASVATAVSRATSVVRSDGGYVSSENANAGPGQPSQARAVVTFKVPVAGYQPALASLSGRGLGTQLSLTQQAQDVTQQVADTASRVASDQAAIGQLRSLLKRAGSVAELLSVQNQIDGQESDLEAMLAQQSALDRETAYATLTLTLVGPKAVVAPAKQSPPPGLAGGLSRGWHAFRVTVSWLLTALGAAAPFLAAVLVIGGLAWWGRRRVRGRRQQPAAGPGA
jgi:hypothetical protein